MQKSRKVVDFRAAKSSPATDPLPARTAEVHARYAEYVHLLDEVPVLLDVVSEPPRAVIRDFRLGQRPNVRKAAREDAYLAREQHSAEREDAYREYVLSGGDDVEHPPAPLARAQPRKKKQKPSKGGKRSKRRKR
jgi:hypothetical protein